MSIPPEESPRDALTESPGADHPSIPAGDGNAEPDALPSHAGEDRAGLEELSLPGEPLFANYEYVRTPPPLPRKPNFGDLLIFLLLAFGGIQVSGLLVAVALHYRLFGVSNLSQAQNEIHYKLGSQAGWYLITLLVCAVVFPIVWAAEGWVRTQDYSGPVGFFDGIHWRASAALRHVWRLLGAAAACFLVAIGDEILMPGPANTPIDETFHMPGAIWLLFGFGVTLAPLLEEITYRGFLLPSLCTAYDWMVEQLTGTKPPPTGEGGRVPWSLPGMVVASVVTSIPFALMHGKQTAYSMGPFLLLFAISLLLCWIRLATRSLAASVLVHSSYNLLLFGLMFLGTGGFRHLERM